MYLVSSQCPYVFCGTLLGNRWLKQKSYKKQARGVVFLHLNKPFKRNQYSFIFDKQKQKDSMKVILFFING